MTYKTLISKYITITYRQGGIIAEDLISLGLKPTDTITTYNNNSESYGIGNISVVIKIANLIILCLDMPDYLNETRFIESNLIKDISDLADNYDLPEPKQKDLISFFTPKNNYFDV